MVLSNNIEGSLDIENYFTLKPFFEQPCIVNRVYPANCGNTKEQKSFTYSMFQAGRGGGYADYNSLSPALPGGGGHLTTAIFSVASVKHWKKKLITITPELNRSGFSFRALNPQRQNTLRYSFWYRGRTFRL